MTDARDLQWSTRGHEDPSNPKPVSTFPAMSMYHVVTGNVVPVDSPARLENHKTSFASLLASVNQPLYAIDHSSAKAHQQNFIKSHEDANSGKVYERVHDTSAATAYAIKSARFGSIAEKLRTPSAAKKALATWKKEGKQGLPPQHMIFSAPVVRKVEGWPQLCIECTLDKAYPNFHIHAIYQYLDHTETMDSTTKRIQVAFVVVQTKENSWTIALEQRGKNDASIKGLIGDAEYARLEKVEMSNPEAGAPMGSAMRMSKKIMVPSDYDLSYLWCQAEGFYQINLYIPEPPAAGNT